MKIEVSFDDANVSDIKAANLLTKYGFQGTFYMPSIQLRGVTLMSLKEVFDSILSTGHLIGGHTMTHPSDLKMVDDMQLKMEIEQNKLLCDMLMQKAGIGKCDKFCYPRGRHDERVRAAVQAAGYREARTTRVLQIRNDMNDPFQTPTTIHMFPREEYEGRDWLELGKELFLKAKAEGEFFSLWGHTAELNRNSDWVRFEELLAYMKNNGS